MINYTIKLVNRDDIKEFIETNHYSKNINGCISDYCFGLYDNNQLIGALFYGRMAMAGQSKKYGDKVIELRRLCCIDNTLRNTESFFIGATLRWLRKNTDLKTVISYADPNYGHQGTIYKASNFKYLGKTAKGRVIVYNDRIYHDKCIRTKYKGKLKPFASEVKKAIASNDAYYKTQEGKHIYQYSLIK